MNKKIDKEIEQLNAMIQELQREKQEVASIKKELKEYITRITENACESIRKDIHHRTKLHVTQHKFDAAVEILNDKINKTKSYAKSMAAVFFATMIANLAIAVIRAIL